MRGQRLNITGYLARFCIEKVISTTSHCLATFCWSTNCIIWMSLNYKRTYFRHVQKCERYLYLKPFNAFSFTESSVLVLTIKHIFSFFWFSNCTSLVSKLYISIQFILDFWAVLMLETFYRCIFKKIKFNSWSFFRCFFWPVNCTSRAYV